MRYRWLIVVGIVGTIVAVLAAGNAGRGQGSARWEYGVFRGDPVWSWYGPSGPVAVGSGSEFARLMGAAYSTKAEAFEANVLNSLGEQGWELVTAPEKSKYVLRRPK
jgi:hypothetical protein